MTPDRLVARLTELGLPPAESESKRRLVERILRAFAGLAGAVPARAWWVPGRLEVFGKHTDYCGGSSLVGTVPRGLVLVAAPRADGRIRILDASRNEELTIETTGPWDASESGWRNYAHVVARRLARNFPGASLGADVVLGSDLPSAAGMSSSSALVVGLARALAALAHIEARPDWREQVDGSVGQAGYFACIENGMSYGTLTGDAGVGTHGGSEDHVAILCSRPGQVSEWSFVPIRHTEDVRIPEEWTFVIAASGVAARKTGDARDAYNRLSREARALLDLWNATAPPQPSLHAALISGASAADRLRHHAPPELRPRLDHFVRENGRIREAVLALRHADRTRLSQLAEASQADAEALLGNQIPETIALVRMARALGAFAASSFGAGFGGSVWALVGTPDAGRFVERWLATYRARFPHRIAATTFIAHPGPASSALD